MEEIDNCYEDGELIELFAKLFKGGFAAEGVRREIAPEGWAASPLVALFHPSAEQRYREAVQMHRNLVSLARKDDAQPYPPEPTFDEIGTEDTGSPIEADEEISRVVGMCLWDIFSDGHDVVDADGREVSLGSFRASGEFLSNRLNEQVLAGLVKGPAVDARQRAAEVAEQMRKFMPGAGSDLMLQFMQDQQTGPYDYMDFYLGTGTIAGRADLSSVYRMIFTRLKALDLNWKYTFPKLHLVDMRPMRDVLDAKQKEESGEPEWLNYSPEQEMEKEEENRSKDKEIAEFQESLDEGYRESVEEAMTKRPPLIVQVYTSVFGHLPEGWPPA